MYAGKRYAVGEKIETPDSCSIVNCNQYLIESKSSNIDDLKIAQMTFVYAECPEDLGLDPELESEDTRIESLSTTIAITSDEVTTSSARLNGAERVKRAVHPHSDRSACYWSYTKGQCCGNRRCANTTNSEPEVTCHFENRTYREGEKIFSNRPEHGCTSCLCTKDFDPANYGQGAACSPLDCLSAVMEERIRSGCTPIYHGNGCCPYDYYCRECRNHLRSRIERFY